ncbi:MAG: ARMT1-like domain-containing protein [Dictyoglomaceae bacterium]|nr:ARMT1-like domain-containing protein [Dictyoglomaceae bacterium]
MKTRVECFPCFLNQVISATKRVWDNEERKIFVIKESAKILPELSFEDSPAYNTYLVLKRAYEILGNSDPYYQEKRKYNKIALSLYPILKEFVKNSEDPLYTATKIAISGNIIDLGILDISSLNLKDYIKEVLRIPLALDHFEYFKEEIKKAKNIVYLLDNAGEIVFDKVFIEELKDKNVFGVVNTYPIINDALMEDALEINLNEVCKLIESGTQIVGKIPELGSEEFKKIFYMADLIIAKGQGNYENLNERNLNIFFLLKAKCEIIAKSFGVNYGDLILAYGPVLNKKL